MTAPPTAAEPDDVPQERPSGSGPPTAEPGEAAETPGPDETVTAHRTAGVHRAVETLEAERASGDDEAGEGGTGDGDGASGEGAPGEGAGASPAPQRRSRRRRWARRLGVTAVVLLVAVTSFSFAYNAATAGRAREPAGLEFVQAGDVRTRYLRWGAQGSPIVLVHGAAESADTWEAVAGRLAAGHRVFALDLTGWGYSERRGPYDVVHQAEQLLGFLDAMGLDHVTLVGHSSGAGVIAEAALRAPSRAAGLVMLDGDALDTGAGAGADGLRFALRDPYRTTLLRLAIRSDWVIRTIYESQCGPACPRLDRAGVDRWRRPFQVAGAERALWSMRGVIGLPAYRVAALSGLPARKAVVFGAGDDVFSRAAPYETARRLNAPPPVIIPGARHLSLVSHPRQVADALAAVAR
ncbi:alpha/beta fold hydrolase [Actinomadura roseirufa]|uniref:alpha/beta fold hydrolase n=1 Tax=Actinomadura roseirufa TaxID=2094049 RepID=UPI0010412A38|nr:alpha/beta hydrolase [Actinomadura roseirufa]